MQRRRVQIPSKVNTKRKLTDKKARMDSIQKPPNFNWRVNNERAYFELGPSSENDDQYTINITVIAASYLHLLAKGNQDDKWVIRYKAFDCDISSDKFTLSIPSDTDPIGRTYIGDKATAKIRANGGVFCQFLTSTTIEFQAVQLDSSDEKKERIAGITCLDLKELAEPGINELKYILQLVSPNSDVQEQTQTPPEIRVLVCLDIQPNFYKSLGDIRIDQHDVIEKENSEQKMVTEDEHLAENISKLGFEDGVPEPTQLGKVVTFEEGDMPDSIISQRPSLISASSASKVLASAPQHSELLEGEKGEHAVVEEDEHLVKNISKVGFEDGVPEPARPFKGVTFQEDVTDSIIPHISASRSASTASKVLPSAPHRSELLQEMSSDEDNNQEKYFASQPKSSVHVTDIVKAGKYRVIIKFVHLKIQSRTAIRDPFQISFVYAPLEMNTPVVCKAEPDLKNINDRNRCFLVDGAWEYIIILSHLSDELLREPIFVEIKKLSAGDSKLLYAQVPFGNVFFQGLQGRKRMLAGHSEVLKTRDNRKVGVLNYIIKLESLEGYVDCPYASHNRTDKATNEIPNRKSRADFENWRRAEEEAFKQKMLEKEKAYLRILSEEWAKRDAEREAITTEKLKNVTEREKKAEFLLEQMQLKEGKLTALESDIKAAAVKTSAEHSQVIETTKFRIRQLEAEHKHEVDLLRKQQQDSRREYDKIKDRVLVLENKLRTKDDELQEVMSARHKWPDVQMTVRLNDLEKENEFLRQQLLETERERDKYKKEIGALCQRLKIKQRQQDERLQKENDILKVQLIANEQKQEMKEERQSVKELGERIKILLETPNRKPRTGRVLEGLTIDCAKPPRETVLRQRILEAAQPMRQLQDHDSIRADTEKEIERLVKERTSLLNSGSFSQYDAVVREIENRITTLATRVSESVARRN